MVQKAAVEGGVNWEGLGEDGFFAANLGWDGVERRVSHGEWVVSESVAQVVEVEESRESCWRCLYMGPHKERGRRDRSKECAEV